MMQIWTSYDPKKGMDWELMLNTAIVLAIWIIMIVTLIYVALKSKFDDSPEEKSWILYGIRQEYNHWVSFLLTWMVLLTFRIAICVLILYQPTKNSVKVWKIAFIFHIVFQCLNISFFCGLNDINKCKDKLFGTIVNFIGFFSCLFLTRSNSVEEQDLIIMFNSSSTGLL